MSWSALMRELMLVALSIVGGWASWRLWPRHKLASVVVFVGLVLLTVWLARRWGIDLTYALTFAPAAAPPLV